tara:strand:+ start:16 stop:291 length:276 start_codon:yes stop_codon:yes gene_type:complete
MSTKSSIIKNYDIDIDQTSILLIVMIIGMIYLIYDKKRKMNKVVAINGGNGGNGENGYNVVPWSGYYNGFNKGISNWSGENVSYKESFCTC